MTLLIQQQAVVDQAYRRSVALEFTSISRNWSNGRWLQARNRYKLDATSRLKRDQANSSPIENAQLRQYIAASAVLHCFDGWTYLSRALDARLRGDNATAYHLAYYAELRAAMSILAAEGIGVFNNAHYVIDRDRKCVRVPRSQGTHEFVWDALEHWAARPAAQALLFSVITPLGVPLKEWLDAFSIGPAFGGLLATRWLKQWGVDLKRFVDDRKSRNTASYRPTHFSGAPYGDVSSLSSSLSELWLAHEPLPAQPFATVDRLLLRLSLETYFREAHKSRRTPKQAKALYRKLVKAMLHHLVTEPAAVELETYLVSGIGSPAPLVDDAAGDAQFSDNGFPTQLCARAALLLRVSTGSAGSLMSKVALRRESLAFWWSEIGKGRCLWDDIAPTTTMDLWADIRDAIDELDTWSSGGELSYRKLWREKASAASALGSCERIALWGLGL